MGQFFEKIKQAFSPKSKYDKLTREDVVEAICKLENEVKRTEDELIEKQKQVDVLMEKGRKETSKEIKLFYAKKINALKNEREQSVRRSMYLMKNIELLNRLKTAIDDKSFFDNTSKQSLGGLFNDKKGLEAFLTKTLNQRYVAENTLTETEDIFKGVDEAYEPNKSIYGMSDADNELLAMFEKEDMVADEQEMFSDSAKKDSAKNEEK